MSRGSKGIGTSALAIVAIIIIIVAGIGGFFAGQGSIARSVSTVTVSGGSTVTTTTTTTVTNGGATPAPIKIGILTSLSGGGTDVGKEYLLGAQLAVQQIDAQGGICYAGVCHNVTLDVADDGSGQTSTAITGIAKLVQDGVVAVVCFPYTGDVFATENTLVSHKVLALMTAASANQLTEQVQNNYSSYKYLFRVGVNDSSLAYGAFQFLKLVNASSYALIGEDFQYAHYEGTDVQNLTQGTGIQNVMTAYTSYSATDYSAQITQIDSTHPGAVVMIMSGANGFDFLKQMKADPVASKIPIYLVGGPWGSRDTVASLNTAQSGSGDYIVDGTYGYQLPVTLKTMPFCNAIEQQFKASCNLGLMGSNYDAVYVLANAIQTAGTLNPDSLVTALENTDLIGATGRIVFTNAHQSLIGVNYIPAPSIEWIHNNATVIYPQSLAQGNYIPPP